MRAAERTSFAENKEGRRAGACPPEEEGRALRERSHLAAVSGCDNADRPARAAAEEERRWARARISLHYREGILTEQ